MIGTLNSEPAADLMTLAEYTSAVPFMTITAMNPAPSQVRIMVPILPGSWSLSRTIMLLLLSLWILHASPTCSLAKPDLSKVHFS